MKKFSSKDNITIGVAAHGNVETTRTCVNKIINSIEGNFELILVDDCSPDNNQTKNFFKSVQKETPNTKVFSFNENLEYTESVNCILSHSTGQKILFVSNDVFINSYYLEEVIEISNKSENIGTVRGVSNFIDNESKIHQVHINGIQQIDEMSKKIYEKNKSKYIEEKFLTGDVFLVNRTALEKVGYYDNLFYGYFADHDLGIRLRSAGYKLILSLGAFSYHDKHINFNYLKGEEKKKKLHNRFIKVYENWARFKLKYSLPVNFIYPGVDGIPWDELVKKNTKNIFLKKKDYSKYLI